VLRKSFPNAVTLVDKRVKCAVRPYDIRHVVSAAEVRGDGAMKQIEGVNVNKVESLY
jgi:hypothetical protein